MEGDKQVVLLKSMNEILQHYGISEEDIKNTLIVKRGRHKDIETQMKCYGKKFGAIRIILDFDPNCSECVMRVAKNEIPNQQGHKEWE